MWSLRCQPDVWLLAGKHKSRPKLPGDSVTALVRPTTSTTAFGELSSNSSACVYAAGTVSRAQIPGGGEYAGSDLIPRLPLGG